MSPFLFPRVIAGSVLAASLLGGFTTARAEVASELLEWETARLIVMRAIDGLNQLPNYQAKRVHGGTTVVEYVRRTDNGVPLRRIERTAVTRKGDAATAVDIVDATGYWRIFPDRVARLVFMEKGEVYSIPTNLPVPEPLAKAPHVVASVRAEIGPAQGRTVTLAMSPELSAELAAPPENGSPQRTLKVDEGKTIRLTTKDGTTRNRIPTRLEYEISDTNVLATWRSYGADGTKLAECTFTAIGEGFAEQTFVLPADRPRVTIQSLTELKSAKRSEPFGDQPEKR